MWKRSVPIGNGIRLSYGAPEKISDGGVQLVRSSLLVAFFQSAQGGDTVHQRTGLTKKHRISSLKFSFNPAKTEKNTRALFVNVQALSQMKPIKFVWNHQQKGEKLRRWMFKSRAIWFSENSVFSVSKCEYLQPTNSPELRIQTSFHLCYTAVIWGHLEVGVYS